MVAAPRPGIRRFWRPTTPTETSPTELLTPPRFSSHSTVTAFLAESRPTRKTRIRPSVRPSEASEPSPRRRAPTRSRSPGIAPRTRGITGFFETTSVALSDSHRSPSSPTMLRRPSRTSTRRRRMERPGTTSFSRSERSSIVSDRFPTASAPRRAAVPARIPRP